MHVYRDFLLVNVVVLAALLVVAPMALGGRWRWWALGATSVAVGMSLPVGWAGWFVLPLAVPVLGAARRRLAGRGSVPLEQFWAMLPVVWAVVAVGALAASLGGVQLFGTGEPIARLTVVHFWYAGVGALVVATRMRASGICPRWSTVGAVATAGAPPFVALGFVLRHPIPQVGGAVLMTVGVWATAVTLLVAARRWRGPRRVAALVAGLATWVPMVLAVSWAASNYWLDVPALPVPVMARTHGVINAVGFVIAGLYATKSAALAVQGATVEPMSGRAIDVVAA